MGRCVADGRTGGREGTVVNAGAEKKNKRNASTTKLGLEHEGRYTGIDAGTGDATLMTR